MPVAKRAARITIGRNAGGGFQRDRSLQVAYHATRTYADGTTERGVFVERKWLADRDAFDREPTTGWAYEHWFEWADSQAKGGAE